MRLTLPTVLARLTLISDDPIPALTYGCHFFSALQSYDADRKKEETSTPTSTAVPCTALRSVLVEL